jgi:GNAT superfamily N-acetyltransferase
MEFTLLGWPGSGPTLRLDFREFSYAGKFVMSNTGKAVVRDPDAPRPDPPDAEVPVAEGVELGSDADPFDRDVLAAAAFNEDRTDPGVLWIRYITVRHDRRGEDLGARLAAVVADRAESRGYRRLRIAVNNPYAYHALYKAGFVYTGRETGLAELVLERPGERDMASYQTGLDVFRESASNRGLDEAERRFLAEKDDCDPPDLVRVEGNGDSSSRSPPTPR